MGHVNGEELQGKYRSRLAAVPGSIQYCSSTACFPSMGYAYRHQVSLSCPQTTSNARNEAMFKEATVFAQHLRVVEKELNQWQRDIECERRA
jgi:hypothetical protein